MLASAALALVVALAAPSDTVPAATPAGPVSGIMATAMRPATDTVVKRRRSVEVSEWYERRLRIHRYGSYTIYPLFAFQAIAGNQIYQDQKNAPEWARTGHRAGATALATVFTLNTVTGLWNLWESRSVEQGRTKRTLHALLMLASDGGFTYAGAKLAEDAENSQDKRNEHRTWAYGSMATALTGVGLMTLWKD